VPCFSSIAKSGPLLHFQTVSAIVSFLLALVLYPDVQTRAQEELDRVIGTDRLPTFDDRPTLPYIEGIVKETLR
jgi:cytochrome P450